MVQVDVFWGYGFGASLAMACGRQVLEAAEPFYNKYVVQTILFLALIWSPTGLLLLIRHPSWETMQAAADFVSMSEWIVLAFGITNVTQGILGFWVGIKLMEKGKFLAANYNWMIGYLGLFFILIYGWDGLGYDRFFYDRDMLTGSPAWIPGAGVGTDLAGFFNGVVSFLQSSVFVTLMLDGVYLLPPFIILCFLWLKEGYGQKNIAMPSTGKLLTSYLFSVFVTCLGASIWAAVCVGTLGIILGAGEVVFHAGGFYAPENMSMHILSYVIGLPLGFGSFWLLLARPGMLLSKPLQVYSLDDDIWQERNRGAIEGAVKS
jgi:hypothetical protein